MKTPIYTKIAQRNWMEKRKKAGYCWATFFTTKENVAKLKEFYAELKKSK
jgi:hypothetical protein